MAYTWTCKLFCSFICIFFICYINLILILPDQCQQRINVSCNEIDVTLTLLWILINYGKMNVNITVPCLVFKSISRWIQRTLLSHWIRKMGSVWSIQSKDITPWHLPRKCMTIAPSLNTSLSTSTLKSDKKWIRKICSKWFYHFSDTSFV